MKSLDAVLSRIDQDIDQSVERLFALLRIASVSTDPAFKDQCRAAAEHVAADLKSIGFEAYGAPDGRSPGRGRQVERRGRPARSFLRPLRRPAGRSFESMEDAAVRAAHRNLAGWPQDYRRARCLRRQRPGDDLHRGLPCLQGRHRQAAAADHYDDRRRGRMRFQRTCSASSATMPLSSNWTWRSFATPPCGTRRRRR